MAKNKLNIKQKQFAEKLLEPGMNQTKAYMEVYNQDNRHIASVSSSELMKNPEIHVHIRQIMDKYHPDRAKTASNVIMEIITNPESTNTERLNAIKLLASIEGWNSPKQSQILNAKVDLSKKYKLPGTD